MPKFLGIDNIGGGLCAQRLSRWSWRASAPTPAATGSAIPGREYTLNDCVKINLRPSSTSPAATCWPTPTVTRRSVAELWTRFERTCGRRWSSMAEGLDFHVEHMHEVFPELVLDLLCHGPIERGWTPRTAASSTEPRASTARRWPRWPIPSRPWSSASSRRSASDLGRAQAATSTPTGPGPMASGRG